LDQHFLKQDPQDSEQLLDVLNKQAEFDNLKAAAEAEKDPTKLAEKPAKRLGFQRWDLKMMMEMMQSQKKAQGNSAVPTWPRNSLGNLNPKAPIPEKNIWEKPPSQTLVLRKQANWWDKKISRLEPPLEKAEWELLGKLARGLQDSDDAWKLPRRRTPAQQLHNDGKDQEDQGWDWERHARQPISEVEKGKLPVRQLRSGERPSGPFGLSIETRAPTSRWFRRAYEQTWMLTPYAEKDPKSSKLVYKWGGGPSRTKTPSPLQMSVFDGVDEVGQPRKEKSP
jgi:hypothetical protein